jgi:hypothetical protein
VGPVMPDPCEHFQGLIAMEVVGQLTTPERVALSAHIEGCESCRDEQHDLMMLSMVLGTADPDRFNDHELPFALQSAVLERLRAEERRERRNHRSRYVVGSAAAAVLVAIAVVLTLVWPSGPMTTTVALVGLPTVHATARLTAEPWGTAMDLRESGQPSGEVLSVFVRTVSGSWWQTGTYRTVGTSVHVDMACALKMSNIKSVWVRAGSGHTVMHGYLPGRQALDVN